jgi:hypothetical protein
MQAFGYYNGRVVNWYTEKSRSGNLQLCLELKLTGFNEDSASGEMGPITTPKGDQVATLRRKIFLSFHTNMIGRTKADLIYLGYPAAEKFDLKRMIPGSVDSIDFGAKDQVFECSDGTYEDKKSGQTKVKEEWRLCRKGGITPSREEIDQLNQAFEEAEAKSPF